MAGAYIFLALRETPFTPDIQVSLDEDAPLSDLVEAFREFCLGCGYAPELVERVALLSPDEDTTLRGYDTVREHQAAADASGCP